jgi:sialate O-acetylesterase
MKYKLKLTIAMAATLFLMVVTITLSVTLSQTSPSPPPPKFRMANTFNNNMIFQQGKSIKIWGINAEKGGVFCTLENTSLQTEEVGEWHVIFPSMTASFAPFRITCKNGDRVVDINNVLIGDVYLCGGQSNMALKMFQVNAEAEAVEGIRVISVGDIGMAKTPMKELKNLPSIPWSESTKSSMPNFSAACYYFGLNIYKEKNIPIGLISSNHGNTLIETWIPSNDEMLYFNTMINPFTTMSLSGIIWHQGESDYLYYDNSDQYYQAAQPYMINAWRKIWEDTVPFFLVQLHPFFNSYYDIPLWKFRFAQISNNTMSLPKTCWASAIDLTDYYSPYEPIHFRNKSIVGHRLSLCARNIIYNEDVNHHGPRALSATLFDKDNDPWIRIVLDTANLVIKDTPQCPETQGCAGFIISENSREYVPKNIIYYDNIIEIQSPVVSPETVMYGLAKWPLINIWNSDGLPIEVFYLNIE